MFKWRRAKRRSYHLTYRALKQKRKLSPRKAARKTRLKHWCYFLFSIVILAGLFYILFLSPYFIIQKTTFEGLQTLTTAEAQRHLENYFQEQQNLIIAPNHLLWLSRKDLEAGFLEKFAVVESVNLKKKLPDYLKISFQERQPVMEILSAGKHFLADRHSVLYQELFNPYPDTKEPTIPHPLNQQGLDLLYNENNDLLALRQTILGEKVIDAILQVSNQLKALKIAEIAFLQVKTLQPDSFQIITKEGWRIYWNLEEDWQVQLNRLDLLLKEKIKAQRSKLDYIDLRFGEKVYYKYKN